jgi:cell division protein FtsL
MSPRPAYDRLSAHEEICAERYEGIDRRLTRIEKALIWAMCAIVTSLWGIVIALVVQLFKIGSIATKLG